MSGVILDDQATQLRIPREPLFGERQGAARYLDALRQHWVLVLALVVAATAAAALYSFSAEKRYEAEADVLVMPVSAGDDTFIGIGLLRESDHTRSVLTAARLIKTPQVADDVLEIVDVPFGRDELLASIDVTPLEQSNIIAINAEAGSPDDAVDIANGFATVVIAQRTEQFQRELLAVIDRLSRRLDAIPAADRQFGEAVAIQQRLGGLSALVGAQDPTLRVASAAVPPSDASWPRPTLSIAVAFLAALLLGSGAAVALELVNPRVSREDELLLVQRLPILARIPRMQRKLASRYLTSRAALPPGVREAYRTLRASLASAGPDGDFPKTILVTSALPGEGKTMTAVNLALTLASADMRVVLVDGDLRRPMVGTAFNVPVRRDGVAGVLTGKVPPEAALVPAPGLRGKLSLLLASPEHAMVVDLLDPSRIERMLTALQKHADVVVVDSPPITQVADALNLAAAVDAVLVAIRLGRTRRDKLNELRQMLAQRGVAPVGFVVIGRRYARRGDYYAYSTPQVAEIRRMKPPRRPRRPGAGAARVEER